MEYRLLEKTEIWIAPLRLAGADLADCASAVGAALGLAPDQIMVTDAQQDHLTLDVLVPTVKAANIVAREKELLAALARVPGVKLSSSCAVHSEGVLGMISLDEETGREVLERSQKMASQVAQWVKSRALVLATGPEVARGQIRDTNSPYLLGALKGLGLAAESSAALPDHAPTIARRLQEAVGEGFGLIVTTGGVGAEGKDQTLEALARVDAEAATPYVLKFVKGQGRHQKDGVRLGVGQVGVTTIVCLPGPHDEVRLLWPVLQSWLGGQGGKAELAQGLAAALREKFLAHSPLHAHGAGG